MATDLDGLEAKLAIYGQGAGHESVFHTRAIKYAALQPTRVNYTLCVRIFELSKNKTVIKWH